MDPNRKITEVTSDRNKDKTYYKATNHQPDHNISFQTKNLNRMKKKIERNKEGNENLSFKTPPTINKSSRRKLEFPQSKKSISQQLLIHREKKKEDKRGKADGKKWPHLAALT
uniref:Uncharacterized protein n=1 Tax=Cacopsylla melanoneura TaxID=428564 RepID=A0A8D8TQE4_9HEMI